MIPAQACRGCGVFDELRGGWCWDCASRGELKRARWTVLQQVKSGLAHLRTRHWFEAKCDFRWAWQRFTRTGDYAPGGYLDQEYGNTWKEQSK